MTQHQKYRIIRKLEGLEIREYLPCVIADVEIEGDRDSAPNQGFSPLFQYISSNKIAMTSPVLQEELPNHKWRVSFVMPTGSTLEELPLPANSQVTLRNSERHTAAAIKFSGKTTHATLPGHEETLRQLLGLNGLTANGAVRVARFDPPWKPPFARHNEMIIPVNS